MSERLCYSIYDGDKVELDIDGVKHRLSFYNDNDCEDPRNWDPIATMLCWSRSYKLGDKNSYEDIHDALVNLCEQLGLDSVSICEYKDDDNTPQQRDRRIIEELKDYACIKFLYLYDHSGITISTSDFRDPWDSGIVGIIYMDKPTTLANFPSANEDVWYSIADQHIEDEVKEYDQWITGDIWGYTLEKITTCKCCGKEETETVDSMGSFFGNDVLSNGMLEYLPEEFVNYFKEVK